MAERGKAEETERTEADRRAASPAEWVEFIRQTEEHMHALFGDSADVDVRLHTAGEDPSDVDVVVEAKLASIPVMVAFGEHFIQRASRVNRPGTDLLPELDVPVERDDAYYDEVRQAVGRGAPTVLLGTSTRSLERSFQQLETSQQSKRGPASEPTKFADSEAPPLTEALPKRAKVAIRLLRYLVTAALWYVAVFAIYGLISSDVGWPTRLLYVFSALFWCALAVAILIPKFRAVVIKWAKRRTILKYFVPSESSEQSRQAAEQRSRLVEQRRSRRNVKR